MKNKIVELEAGKLIEPIDLAAHTFESLEGMATSYRIRPRGHFHFELASDCSYIEEMAKVTSILSQDPCHYELTKETDAQANVENAERFYQYLMSIYREQNIEDEFLPRHVLERLRKSIASVKDTFGKRRKVNAD